MRNGRNGKIQKSYNSKYNTYKQIKSTKLKYKFVLKSFAIKNYRNYESNKITKITAHKKHSKWQCENS